MNRLLLALSSGLFVFFIMHSEESKHLKAQTLKRSCLNYPYDLGINLKQNPSGSFRLLSTSLVNIKIDNASFVSRSLREATLRAKLNISNFIKLTNNSKYKKIKDFNFPIIIDGRKIRTNSQFETKIKKGFIDSSSNLKGVRQIAMCNKGSDHVMVTLEVTNETIRASNYINRAK